MANAALQQASSLGNTDIVRYLIQRDPTLLNASTFSDALNNASLSRVGIMTTPKHLDTMKYLLSKAMRTLPHNEVVRILTPMVTGTASMARIAPTKKNQLVAENFGILARFLKESQ